MVPALKGSKGFRLPAHSFDCISANVHCHLVFEIIHNYIVLMKSGSSARFACVPSYVDVFGNEEEDRVAKTLFHISSEAEIPYRVIEIGGLVKRYIMSKMESVHT